MQPDASAGSDLEAVRIKALQDNAGRLGLTWDLRTATVVQGLDANAALIVFDGDGNPEGIQAVSMVGPLLAGQRVYAITSPPSANHVVGVVEGRATRLGKSVVQRFLEVGSHNAVTVVPLPTTPTLSFVKYYDDTYVHFVHTCTFFSTGGDTGAAFYVTTASGLLVNVGALFANNGTNSVRQQVAGQNYTAALAAETYSFIGNWQIVNGAGVLNTNADDLWTLSAEEYWP
jgi:hypothetical protein